MKSGSKPLYWYDPVYGVCKEYTSVSNGSYVPSTFKLDCIFFPCFFWYACVYELYAIPM